MESSASQKKQCETEPKPCTSASFSQSTSKRQVQRKVKVCSSKERRFSARLLNKLTKKSPSCNDDTNSDNGFNASADTFCEKVNCQEKEREVLAAASSSSLKSTTVTKKVANEKRKKMTTQTKAEEYSHIKFKNGEYKCTICKRKNGFKSKNHRSYHMYCRSDVKKPFKCLERGCNKSFCSKSHYEYHRKAHRNELAHRCNVCGKGFIQRNKLMLHKRMHTGEKPFPCKHCGKTFANKTGLKCHEMTHSSERPHPCNVCGKTFKQLSNLRHHSQQHLDPDNRCAFRCKFCKHIFSSDEILKSHLKFHLTNRPHQCSQCPSAFNYKKDLKRHSFVHTGVRNLKCVLCGNKHQRKDNLKRHIKSIHQKTDDEATQLALEAETEAKKILLETGESPAALKGQSSHSVILGGDHDLNEGAMSKGIDLENIVNEETGESHTGKDAQSVMGGECDLNVGKESKEHDTENEVNGITEKKSNEEKTVNHEIILDEAIKSSNESPFNVDFPAGSTFHDKSCNVVASSEKDKETEIGTDETPAVSDSNICDTVQNASLEEQDEAVVSNYVDGVEDDDITTYDLVINDDCTFVMLASNEVTANDGNPDNENTDEITIYILPDKAVDSNAAVLSEEDEVNTANATVSTEGDGSIAFITSEENNVTVLMPDGEEDANAVILEEEEVTNAEITVEEKDANADLPPVEEEDPSNNKKRNAFVSKSPLMELFNTRWGTELKNDNKREDDDSCSDPCSDDNSSENIHSYLKMYSDTATKEEYLDFFMCQELVRETSPPPGMFEEDEDLPEEKIKTWEWDDGETC